MIQDIFGDEFYERHKSLFHLAFRNEIALCGSVAACLISGDTEHTPKDIDLVCGCPDAAANFIWDLTHGLMKHNCHFRIYSNSQNRFCPKDTVGHFRITCSFWLPVCLFVLERDKYAFYRIKGGAIIQRPSDVKAKADELTKVDGKARPGSKINLAEPIDFRAIEKSIDDQLREIDRHQGEWSRMDIDDFNMGLLDAILRLPQEGREEEGEDHEYPPQR
jgi:hypothetical protein